VSDGSGRSESAKSSRRGHAAAWIGAVAGVVGAVFTALAFYVDTDGVPDGSASGTESSVAPAPPGGGGVERYSEEETRLARRITDKPTEESLRCQPSETDKISGALATLECSPRGVRFPIKAIAASFRDEGAMNAFVNSESGHVDPSVAGKEIIDQFECPQDGPFRNVKGLTIGRLICYSQNDTYSIVWSFENDSYVDKYGEVFAVKAWSVDRQALAEWWMDTPV
jgi:hypothetical protein